MASGACAGVALAGRGAPGPCGERSACAAAPAAGTADSVIVPRDAPRGLRSEPQRGAQPHLVGAFAGITCLPRRLDADDGIGIELPPGPGAHRAGSGVAERHACLGCEHAAVARKADSVARVHRELACRFELVVRPEPACIVRGPEPLGGAPGPAPCRGDAERQASARGARRHADGATGPPFLVSALLVRDQHAHLPFDGERACDVAQPRPDLDSGARPVSASPPSYRKPTSALGVNVAPLPATNTRSPWTMSRRRVTSPSVPTMSAERALFVPTHMASDFTFSPTPQRPLPSSTRLFTPSAPMRIERSVFIGSPPSCVSVMLPLPAPASAQADACAFRSIRAYG